MPVLRDRGSINLPLLLRINWARRGLRFYYTSHTWHLGKLSRNIRDDTHQDRWDHPGRGWLEGKRKRKR